METAKREPFVKEHLKELSQKFLWIIIPAFAIFILTFIYSKTIITSLMSYINIPIESVVSLTPFESLQTSLSLSGFITLLFIFPMFIFSFYRWTASAMSTKTNKITRKYLYGCFTFAVLGFAFGVFIFSRMVLGTLISTYQLTNAMWSIKSVISFVMVSSLSLALIMQTTMIIPALSNMKLLNVKEMKKYNEQVTLLLVHFPFFE